MTEKPTPGRTHFADIARAYRGIALFLLNTFVVLVVLNLLLFVIFAGIRAVAPPDNEVAAKYGWDTLARVYPDWSKQDLDDMLNENWQRHQIFTPYAMFREAPYRGKYVNVHEAGFRMDPESGPWPPSSQHYTVFLFGGSTTFSYGLPDRDAMGSALQRAMREKYGDSVVVYNFAQGAYQSSQERVAFLELLTMGFVPDMAIFVDGLNEFAFPYAPKGTEDVRQILDGGVMARLKWAAVPLAQKLPMFTLVRGAFEHRDALPQPQNTLVHDSTSADLIDSALRRYQANKTAAGAAAREFGVEAIFVWQPIPFYGYDVSHHVFYSDPSANRFAASGYEVAATQFTQRADSSFIWLADMQRDLKKPLYVDKVHYTAEMTALIADEIVRTMDERGLGPQLP